MIEISMLQCKILKKIFERDVENNISVKIHPDSFDLLEEKNEIMKIRELVYNIDKLIDLNFVSVKDNYYIESDMVSFEYLNSAVEIIEDRITITQSGIEYVEHFSKNDFQNLVDFFKKISIKNFSYKLIISHILFLLIGMLIMWLILQNYYTL